MKCERCGKEISQDKIYKHGGKALCEDCFIHANLFPLGHSGHHGKLFYIKDRKR